tara:strand:+ start:261 stop:476 length:216 start_codon:yes stop_codon:yes gene_type:complete
MIDVDVTKDLEVVMAEINKIAAELQTLDNNRVQMAQQIQQLNGVAMYLRGKQPEEIVEQEDNNEVTPNQEE